LAVANQNSNTVSVFRNTGSSGTVSYASKVDFTTGTNPRSVAIGDIDGDGKADLVVANNGSNTVSVFRNTGSSGMVSYATKVDFATGISPSSVAIGDMDGDSKADLAVANAGPDNVSVFRNTGSSGTVSYATKVDFTAGTNPRSVAIGDLDGDGKADLAVANSGSDNVSVFRNTGSSGTVSYATKVDFTTGISPISTAIGDLDGDGKPDLAVANNGGNTVSVIRNNPVFAPVITGVSIPNVSMKIGDVITATVTVNSNPEVFTLGVSTIGGFALSGLSKINNTTYTATFVIASGGTDVAAGSNIPVSVVLSGVGGSSAPFLIAIAQGADQIDANAPAVTSVTSSTANGIYGVGSVIAVNVVFSELVNVTGTPTITLETGAIDRTVNYSSGTGTNTLTFNYTIQAGDVSVDLDYVNTTALTAGTSIRDVGLNNASLTLFNPGTAGSLGANKAIAIDGVAPTVTINQAVAQADPTNASPVNFTVVFSKAITPATFTASDVTITGTATGVVVQTPTTSDNITWTVPVTVTGGGTIIATIAANRVQDPATNNNTASTSTDNTITFDNVAPTVTINQAVAQADPTNASPVNFTVVFSKAITPATFTASDVTITGTATGVTVQTPTTSDNITWTVPVTVTGPGTIIATLAANRVQDPATNNNTASTSTDNTITFDNVAPTVTINQAVAQADPTNASPVNFTVVFSKAITPATFTASDVTITGTATGVVVQIPTTSDNITWTVPVTVTGPGTIIATIAANRVQDPATNNNTASTSTDNTITFNIPTITFPATNLTICSGNTGVSLPYSTTTNSPDFYSIDFDAAGNSAGFVDQVNQVLPSSPISVFVPGAAAPGVYNASITVTNSVAGISSIGYSITVTINPTPVLSSTLTPAAICSGTIFSYTATSATVGSTFSWSRALVAGISQAANSSSGDVTETLTNTTHCSDQCYL
jgi:hypothetical protein